jgi:hypothetical protein
MSPMQCGWILGASRMIIQGIVKVAQCDDGYDEVASGHINSTVV